MAVQTSITSQSGALLGMWADAHGETLAFKQPAASVAKVVTVTIDTSTNSTLYQIRVNGIDSEYTSDGSATAAEIEAGLVAAVNANPLAAAIVTAAAGAGDTLTLTGVTAGVDFTVTVSGATLSVATTTGSQDASYVGFGYGVVVGSAANICRMPSAADAATAFRGVALHSHSMDPLERPASTTPDGYFGQRPVSVVRKGRIYVPVVDTITAGSSGIYLYVTPTNCGKFGGAASSGNTVDLGGTFTGLRWAASSSSSMAVLELNLP